MSSLSANPILRGGHQQYSRGHLLLLDLSSSFAQVVNPITQINNYGAAEEIRKIIFRVFRM